MKYPSVLVTAAVAFGLAAANPAAAAPPARVVSINLCTDQLAMRIAAPGQLVSISRLSHDPEYSIDVELTRSYPANNGSAEEVIGFEPDLVLAGTFTTREAVALLRELGHRVETFPLTSGMDDIRHHIQRMGALLGQPKRAATELDRFNAILDAARQTAAQRPRQLIALSYGANGFTNGAGTIGDEIITAAGYTNLARELGFTNYVQMPLELVLLNQPDLVITDSPPKHPARAHEILSHPALDRAGFARVHSSGQYWICGGPYTALAVQELAEFPMPN